MNKQVNKEMSYRNNANTSQESDDFHNLKDSISETDFTGELGEEVKRDVKRKDNKFEKKFLFKKESKDKGYSSLAGNADQDSVFLVNTKNPKKTKADTKIASLSVFKKSFKDEKRLKDIKETKEELKKNKKLKQERKNLFGNHLENAVRSFPSNDGVKVPAPIRICLDIIEQKGIENEHLYRRSVNKSQLETICDFINNNRIESKLDELNSDPNFACAVIKKFLRELKSPLMNDDVLNILEKVDSNVSDKEIVAKVELLKKQIGRMPQPNLDTFAYLIMHFHRILYRCDTNKAEIGIFLQKFQPLFRIREKLFKFLISHADLLFSEFRFKKYGIKTNDQDKDTIQSRFSMLPDNIEDLEQEISRQEIYLSKLHSKIANEESSSDKTVQEQLSEELWALQRYVTSLKRKVKKLKIERQNIETEQLNKLKELQERNSGKNNSRDLTQSGRNTPATLIISDLYPDPNRLLSPVELHSKEMNIICQNTVLIDSIQQLFEKNNLEKSISTDLQQKLFNLSLTKDIQICSDITSKGLTSQESLDNEQLIINENKLLEERINLINKRINVEKDKIFELKLQIQLKTMSNLSSEQLMLLSTQQLGNMNLTGKMVNMHTTDTSKELIMTKL